MADPSHFLITAGPTREPIDPVRYLTNRSSGKMGYAIAEAAAKAGHTVTLVSGPTNIDVPDNVDFVSVSSAEDMYQAVARRIGKAHVCIMTAAVADYTPTNIAEQKIKKGDDTLSLELVRTKDILGSARDPLGFDGLLVGFAAETENIAANALSKLERKRCDIIAANDVSQSGIGFNSAENEIILFHSNGRNEALGKHEKSHLGEMIVAVCERELQSSR